MADPLTRPLKWSKNFQVYVEKHNVYDILQELLKQMIIVKPEDPLTYIRDEVQRVAKGIYSSRTFITGTSFAELFGKRLTELIGAKYATLNDIINNSDDSVKSSLEVFLNVQDNGDDASRKMLVDTIQTYVSGPDFEGKGYILHGFPQSKLQALQAQQVGLLPRQVFIFLPETGEEAENEEEDSDNEYFDEMGPKPVLSASKMAEIKAVNEILGLALKDTASAYHQDICKVISYEKLMKTSKADLEAELLGVLMTVKASHAPFIPRIVVLGPPASGKSCMAEFLSTKFAVVNVDWVELVRGACRWDDEKDKKIADEAKLYLKDLKAMSEDSVKAILTRRLERDDCEKKGWVLHGFPENKKQCQLLETVFLEPNRIFLLTCPLELAISRTATKKEQVMERQLEGTTPVTKVNESGDFLLFPFGGLSVEKRYEKFTHALDGIVPFYGNRIIHVDASMKPSLVKNFVDSSIRRPPIPR